MSEYSEEDEDKDKDKDGCDEEEDKDGRDDEEVGRRRNEMVGEMKTTLTCGVERCPVLRVGVRARRLHQSDLAGRKSGSSWLLAISSPGYQLSSLLAVNYPNYQLS